MLLNDVGEFGSTGTTTAHNLVMLDLLLIFNLTTATGAHLWEGSVSVKDTDLVLALPPYVEVPVGVLTAT